MTTPPDDMDRLVRRIPWTVAIALAVGLVWYGVTRWVGIAFDRDAVSLVVCAFLVVMLHAALDAPPPPPPRTDPGEAAPTVAPEDIILPHERHQPVTFHLVMSPIGLVLAVFFLGVGGWLLVTRPGEADSVGMAAGSILLGLLSCGLFISDLAHIRRLLYVRRLERRRGQRNPQG